MSAGTPHGLSEERSDKPGRADYAVIRGTGSAMDGIWLDLRYIDLPRFPQGLSEADSGPHVLRHTGEFETRPTPSGVNVAEVVVPVPSTAEEAGIKIPSHRADAPWEA